MDYYERLSNKEFKETPAKYWTCLLIAIVFVVCTHIFRILNRQHEKVHTTYDRPVLKFMDEVYKSNLLSYDYLDVIKNNDLNNQEEIKGTINTADFELLTAILTGYIRQERFCEGLFASVIEDKTILKILRRFKKFI